MKTFRKAVAIFFVTITVMTIISYAHLSTTMAFDSYQKSFMIIHVVMALTVSILCIHTSVREK